MRPQNLNKFLQRPGRMPNRKNRSLHFLASHAHLSVLRIKSFSAHSDFPLCSPRFSPRLSPRTPLLRGNSADPRTRIPPAPKFRSSPNFVQLASSVPFLYHVCPFAQLFSNPFSATLLQQPKYETALQNRAIPAATRRCLQPPPRH